MPRRPALPISLYVSGRRCLVVGDGPGAGDRTARLEAAGAHVVCVDAAAFSPADCRGAFAVFAQTDDPERNRTIAEAARAAGRLAYAHDAPDASDFAMPAVARRTPVSLAISTDAAAPALARRLRVELEALLAGADGLEELVAEMESAREAPAQQPRTRRSVLSRLAARLRIEGRIVIETPPPGTAAAGKTAPEDGGD